MELLSATARQPVATNLCIRFFSGSRFMRLPVSSGVWICVATEMEACCRKGACCSIMLGRSSCPRRNFLVTFLAINACLCEFWCVLHPHLALYRLKSGAGLAKCAENTASAEKAAGAETDNAVSCRGLKIATAKILSSLHDCRFYQPEKQFARNISRAWSVEPFPFEIGVDCIKI